MCWAVLILLLANLFVIQCCQTSNKPSGFRKTTSKQRGKEGIGPGPDHPHWNGVGWGRPKDADEFWGKGNINHKNSESGYNQAINRPFLPESWKGIGPEAEGVSPPQWAYFPKNVGRPTLCFQPPLRGECKGEKASKRMQTRYAFNPFSDKCQPFPFSGCHGNENNFKSEKRCNELCKELPGPDCDPDGDSIEIKDFVANFNG